MASPNGKTQESHSKAILGPYGRLHGPTRNMVISLRRVRMMEKFSYGRSSRAGQALQLHPIRLMDRSHMVLRQVQLLEVPEIGPGSRNIVFIPRLVSPRNPCRNEALDTKRSQLNFLGSPRTRCDCCVRLVRWKALGFDLQKCVSIVINVIVCRRD